jgi:hypothetical protein
MKLDNFAQTQILTRVRVKVKSIKMLKKKLFGLESRDGKPKFQNLVEWQTSTWT